MCIAENPVLLLDKILFYLILRSSELNEGLSATNHPFVTADKDRIFSQLPGQNPGFTHCYFITDFQNLAINSGKYIRRNIQAH